LRFIRHCDLHAGAPDNYQAAAGSVCVSRLFIDNGVNTQYNLRR